MLVNINFRYRQKYLILLDLIVQMGFVVVVLSGLRWMAPTLTVIQLLFDFPQIEIAVVVVVVVVVDGGSGCAVRLLLSCSGGIAVV